MMIFNEIIKTKGVVFDLVSIILLIQCYCWESQARYSMHEATC